MNLYKDNSKNKPKIEHENDHEGFTSGTVECRCVDGLYRKMYYSYGNREWICPKEKHKKYKDNLIVSWRYII